MRLGFARVPSPLGPLVLYSAEAALCGVAFGEHEADVLRWLHRRYGEIETEAEPDPAGAVRALEAYFAGELHAIDAVSVDSGGTGFQQRVWSALRAIPVGFTVSYAQLAARVGKPRALRAVGLANARNPLPIVLPCHRVVGMDGALVGYGGGLERKRWLLAHERARVPADRPRQGRLPLLGSE